jgi:transcriptional regulator EpsA
MKRRDTGFINQQHKSTAGKTTDKTAHNDRPKRRATETARLMEDDREKFLQIIEQASQIKCHRELFQLLQSESIQYCIPHQILISAWGDFDVPHLRHDVVSALPGLRTGLLKCRTIDDLLQELYKRWLFHGRQPLLLNSTTDARLAHSPCDCALHEFLQNDWWLLVHGIIDLRDGNVSLYLALNAGSITSGQSIEGFCGRVDPLITQIDVAFRRIAGLKFPRSVNPECRSFSPALSPREEEILMAVSEGKTNTEISEYLAISAYTVKNHLQRIMQKLNATNRTEAVAKRRQMGLRPQMYQVTTKTSPDLMIPLNA